MDFPHIPSIVENADILVPDLLKSQGKLGTEDAIFSIAIGDDQSIVRQIRQHLVYHLVKLRKGQTQGTLDVAFLIELPRPGINEYGTTGQELVFCFFERDQDVLAELQCNPCFRRPVAEEGYGIGADLVDEEAQKSSRQCGSECLHKSSLPRSIESQASLTLREEGGKEKENGHKKKKSISKQVPEHVPARRGADGDGEASAINVKTSGHIEDQGAEKDQQKKITDQNSPREQDAQDQGKTHQQLKPREKERDQVDQHVRQNMIIVNDLGKRHRVDDFVVTRVNEDPSQKQTREENRDASRIPLRPLICHEKGM